MEEQFYLFWPLLLALVVVRRRRRRPAAPARGVALAVAGVVAAASFALSSWLTAVAQPWAFFSLPSRAWELAAGALVALALPWLTRLPRRVAVVLGWSGLAAVGLSFLAIRPGVAFPGLVAAVPVVGTVGVLIAGVTAGSAGPVRLLRLRPLQVIARASYSWYLWHWPPLVLGPVVLGRELSPAWTLLVCVATLAAALVTVVVVEDPIRFSRPLTLRPAASLATGAALTSVAVVTSLVTATLVPPVAGHGVAAAAVQLPAARPAAVRSRSVAAAVSPLEARVSSAVAVCVRIRAVPANLDPSLTRASADKALPFLDGCHLSFTASGRYVDVTPWFCTATTCAAVVGNLLVWRDDNHLSTTYPRWLAPLVAETLAPTGS